MRPTPSKSAKVRTTIEGKMKKPDTDVPIPRRQQEASLVAQLCGLELNACAFKGGYFNSTLTIMRFIQELPGIKERLRNSVASCILSATNQTGFTFSTSTIVNTTAQGRIAVILVIERVA